MEKPITMFGRLGWLVLLAIVAVVIGAAAFYAYDWWAKGRFIVAIDDRYAGNRPGGHPAGRSSAALLPRPH